MKKITIVLSILFCMILFFACAMPEAKILENSPSQTTTTLSENNNTLTPSQTALQETAVTDPSTLLPFIDADGKYGYMDNQGVIKIDPIFDAANRFSEGFAVVAKVGKEGYKAGYIDGTGEIVIPLEYDYAFPVSDGIATVVIDKPEGDTTVYLDTDGKELLRVDYNTADPFREGLAAIKETATSPWRYMDVAGNFVIDTPFADVGDFHEGKARFSTADVNGMGFINQIGNVVLDDFYYVSDFSEGLAAVRKDGIWGYINENGEFVLSFETLKEYDQLFDFHEGMALVLVNNLFGVIDRNGQYIKQPQYKDVGGLYDGLIMIYNYNEQGETIGLHYETLEGMTIEPKE